MRKAMLVEVRDGMILFPQKMPGAEEVLAPTCATCKWAEVSDAGDQTHPLVCWRISSEQPWTFHDGVSSTKPREAPDGALAATDENDGGYARLFVAPTFGCVQWEGM